MKKSGFLWDVLGTTIFGMLFLWGISKIDINLDIVNPISKTFEDFDLTDLVFSQIRENPGEDPNIVLVNIGELDRMGIAEQLEVINKYKPKVVAIDARFIKPKHSSDPIRDSLFVAADSALSQAISKVSNLVMACKLYTNAQEGKVDSIQFSHPMFMKNADTAFVNTISEGENTFKTWRKQNLIERVSEDSIIYSFAAKVAQLYKPSSMKKMMERTKKNDTEIINYRGNINCTTKDGTPNSKITFTALDVYQVLNEEFEPDVIKDKIVLLGFMGRDFDTYSTEDRFFTPLNKNYVGRADQDMYGVIVHANIISMILNENYINEMPEVWVDVVNIAIVFLSILLFTYLYFTLELFWDGATLIITLLGMLLFTSIVVYIFDRYNYVLDFTIATVALFLMPNIIELYYGLIKTSQQKLRKKFINKKDPVKDSIIVKPVDDDEE